MSSVNQAAIPSREERAAQLLRSERAANRDSWRDRLYTMGFCLLFMSLGLMLIAFAFHTTDQKWGQIFFWGGLVVNNGGVLGTLVAAYLRAEERGDT